MMLFSNLFINLLDSTVQTVLNICINLLARYPKTEFEISHKIEEYLARPDFSELSTEERSHIKAEALERLIKAGLINDQEYLDSFIRGNNSSIKPDGTLLIYKKMRQKGIPVELLAAKSQEFEEFDKLNAIKLLQKKFGVSIIPQDLPIGEKQKMAAYLTSRGFRYTSFPSESSEP